MLRKLQGFAHWFNQVQQSVVKRSHVGAEALIWSGCPGLACFKTHIFRACLDNPVQSNRITGPKAGPSQYS